MPTFEDDHAEFSSSVPDEVITTMIMPGRIEQVIANLLENAFRYTPASGRVELAVAREGNDVLTSVKDTGRGIPVGSTEKVFGRFYTTEPKDIPREYGSGLGLAIAKSIVENHQGRIWVESEPGRGATFIFALPIVKS
jgi:signal transduction histidine kinase